MLRVAYLAEPIKLFRISFGSVCSAISLCTNIKQSTKSSCWMRAPANPTAMSKAFGHHSDQSLPNKSDAHSCGTTPIIIPPRTLWLPFRPPSSLLMMLAENHCATSIGPSLGTLPANCRLVVHRNPFYVELTTSDERGGELADDVMLLHHIDRGGWKGGGNPN